MLPVLWLRELDSNQRLKFQRLPSYPLDDPASFYLAAKVGFEPDTVEFQRLTSYQLDDFASFSLVSWVGIEPTLFGLKVRRTAIMCYQPFGAARGFRSLFFRLKV